MKTTAVLIDQHTGRDIVPPLAYAVTIAERDTDETCFTGMGGCVTRTVQRVSIAEAIRYALTAQRPFFVALDPAFGTPYEFHRAHVVLRRVTTAPRPEFIGVPTIPSALNAAFAAMEAYVYECTTGRPDVEAFEDAAEVIQASMTLFSHSRLTGLRVAFSRAACAAIAGIGSEPADEMTARRLATAAYEASKGA